MNLHFDLPDKERHYCFDITALIDRREKRVFTVLYISLVSCLLL